MRLSRRQVLQGAGSATAVLLAGCGASEGLVAGEVASAETEATLERAKALACTIVGVAGTRADGGPLLASNSDDPFTTRTRLVVSQAQGTRFVAAQIVSPPPRVAWSDMMSRGLNEHGLAYTWAYVRPLSEPTYERAGGLGFAGLGLALLGGCRTVDDALGVLTARPRAFHGNFLLADARGSLALVEVSTESHEVVANGREGALARTNHWRSPRLEPIGGGPSASSLRRLDRATAVLSAGDRMTVDSLRRLMSDHRGRQSEGISICVHGASFGTVSSELSDVGRRTFWYAFGWPCGQRPSGQPTSAQSNSWGLHLPFSPDLPEGEYVTAGGQLTALARAQLPGHARRLSRIGH